MVLGIGVPTFGAHLDVALRWRDLEHRRDRLRRLKAERASHREGQRPVVVDGNPAHATPRRPPPDRHRSAIPAHQAHIREGRSRGTAARNPLPRKRCGHNLLCNRVESQRQRAEERTIRGSAAASSRRDSPQSEPPASARRAKQNSAPRPLECSCRRKESEVLDGRNTARLPMRLGSTSAGRDGSGVPALMLLVRSERRCYLREDASFVWGCGILRPPELASCATAVDSLQRLPLRWCRRKSTVG